MANQKLIHYLPQLISHHFSENILRKHVVSAIGYGSGIFPQTTLAVKNTIDLMVIVKERKDFHKDLISYKPGDYSGLTKFLGPSYLECINRNIFPAHFNHIQIDNTKIKYGIVDLKTIVEDLKTWNILTFAGRFQKPVVNLLNNNLPSSFVDAFEENYRMALNIALLQMIGRFPNNSDIPLLELYKFICNISYSGDIRHSVAVQNVNKVENIVKNNIKAFDNIYQPILHSLSKSLHPKTLQLGEKSIRIKYTPELIKRIVDDSPMPEAIKEYLSEGQKGKYRSLSEKLLINGIGMIPKELNGKLGQINRRSSIKMAMQNFLAASLINNLKYVMAKIKKKQLK